MVLRGLYHSPNVVKDIASRRIRWPGLAIRMEECRSAFEILTSKPSDN